MKRHLTHAMLLLLCLPAGLALAQEAVRTEVDDNGNVANSEATIGRLVRIPLPLTGSTDLRIQQIVDQIVSTLPDDGPAPILVFEFWTDGDISPPSDYGRAIKLAEYLTSSKLGRIRTIAYIPNKKIQGHAVLVALACQEIVMHPEGEIGNAGIKETKDGGKVPPYISAAYKDIANRRRTIPEAVALGMLDPQLQIHRLETVQGVRYVTKEELPAVEGNNPMIPAGEMGSFTGADLRANHRFVSRLASDHNQLALEFGIPANQLEIDPSLGGEWRSVMIDVQGPITAAMVGRVKRMIDEQLHRSSNLICLRLDSPGGSPESSVSLASYLASESSVDSSQVRTVAYVPQQALADAAIIALACDQIVMHPNAKIGGDGAYQMDRAEIDVTSDAFKEITEAKRRSWSVPVAMLDPDLAVFEYTLDGSDVKAYFHEDEWKDQKDRKRWIRGQEITKEGEPLELRGERAVEIGLARDTVNNDSELAGLYQLESAPELVRPNWASELVHKLAMPQVAGLLLFIGGFALIAELSSPGIGVGAFVSAVCFLLFFWSQFLNGTAGWLEILLFCAGVVFMLIELLVIPGFGVFGLGGGAMVIASLVLASQTFVFPQNDYQFQQLPKSLMVVAGAGGGVLCSVLLLRKHIRNLPLLNRIVLEPMDDDDRAQLSQRELIANYSDLIDQVGVTTTPLVPSGKARFGDRLVDVVSNGQAVEPNSAIRVVEVAGNRIVVESDEAV